MRLVDKMPIRRRRTSDSVTNSVFVQGRTLQKPEAACLLMKTTGWQVQAKSFIAYLLNLKLP
jgi:hypothetical protein